MLNVKSISNDSPKPKANNLDSGSSKDFDFYGFINPFVYYFTVSLFIYSGFIYSSLGWV